MRGAGDWCDVFVAGHLGVEEKSQSEVIVEGLGKTNSLIPLDKMEISREFALF